MKKTFSDELLWYLSPPLRRGLAVEAQLPPAIELRLERLRLLEAIRHVGNGSGDGLRPLPGTADGEYCRPSWKPQAA